MSLLALKSFCSSKSLKAAEAEREHRISFSGPKIHQRKWLLIIWLFFFSFLQWNWPNSHRQLHFLLVQIVSSSEQSRWKRAFDPALKHVGSNPLRVWRSHSKLSVSKWWLKAAFARDRRQRGTNQSERKHFYFLLFLTVRILFKGFLSCMSW